MTHLAAANESLPDDLLNFHYDPVTCAVALGWPGAVVEEMLLGGVLSGDVFRWLPDQTGQLTRVVVDLDGESFSEAWLSAVEGPQRD